jgi:long-chain acyl-CoA synthetase
VSLSLRSQGWYHTGDVAALIGDRRIRLIDRIKNVFKLSQVSHAVAWKKERLTFIQGEFVAPEKLEMRYQESKFVDQIFITYGPQLKIRRCAITE